MEQIYKALATIKKGVKEWFEWQDIISWAKLYRPSWVHLATQTKKPEIRETYRKKILRAYYEKCWY